MFEREVEFDYLKAELRYFQRVNAEQELVIKYFNSQRTGEKYNGPIPIHPMDLAELYNSLSSRDVVYLTIIEDPKKFSQTVIDIAGRKYVQTPYMPQLSNKA